MFELTRDEWIEIIPILSAVLLALMGWAVTYFHRWYFDNRANKLARVNKQLKELYGPLYARLLASHSAWEAFWLHYRPVHGGESYFGDDLPVSEKEKEVWRNWMTHVFEPNNAEIEKIIVENMDLLEGDHFPDCFVEALAHIAAYKAVLANWKRSDFSEHVSVNNWPSQDLYDWIRPEYGRLRALQRQLLNDA
ncbi:hypothetical protein [Aurantivibrio plasticivorans]